MERLQKLLANAGYFSRRAAETAIAKGRLQINNKTAILGDKANVGDRVLLDNRVIDLSRYQNQETQVLVMNKKQGVICTKKDDKNRPNVFEYLDKTQRWIMIGRLDINSSGLLLFTNNGELAKRLMHPSYQIEREYAVRVLGEVTANHLKKLTTGVRLEDNTTRAFKRVKFTGGTGANTWYSVVLTSGVYREVRRLWQALGFQVSRLTRTRYGTVALPKTLKVNESSYLNKTALKQLMAQVNLPMT